jgi:hypothetical protein
VNCVDLIGGVCFENTLFYMQRFLVQQSAGIYPDPADIPGLPDF